MSTKRFNFFRAWTITADGKRARPETDFTDEGAGEMGIVKDIPILLQTERSRIVHPPAADVGATVICESEELLAPYQKEKIWEIQSGIPIVFEALEIDLPSGVPHAESWHQYQPVKPTEVAPNHWRWEIKDMQKLDLREVRASLEWAALAARMSVDWGTTALVGKDDHWRALGEWFTQLEADRPDPNPEITAKAQELVAGGPDFYTKLRNITDYIQKNVRYFIVVRGIGGLQAHPAADIYRNRFGDCKDKTTLLISMLQATGIHAFYMPVDDRRGVVDPDAPSLAGDHMITAIEIPADVTDPRLEAVAKASNGKRYLIFDPTNERTPVGNLPSYLQGSYGILAAGPASQILPLPVLPPDANGTVRKGSFTLSAEGGITGSVDDAHSGPEGADLRLLLKFTDEKERREYWEKRVARDLQGAALDLLPIRTTAVAR